MAVTLKQADLKQDRDVLVRFNIDYMNWIVAHARDDFGISLVDAIAMTVVEYVEDTLDKLCSVVPPEGIFYLAEEGSEALGMGGLRRSPDGVAEVKRLYVTPAARGKGVGARILDRLIEDARTFRNRAVFLDTGPFMQSAQRLYEAAGFVDIPPYPEAEVPAELRHLWRFMKLDLV